MPHADVTDESKLIEACTQGKRYAQERIYKQYVTAMYNRIIRMVPNSQEAEDLVQETFVKVFDKIGTFRGDSTLGSWIKRIAINTTLSHIRRKKNTIWEPLPEEVEEMPSKTEISYSVKDIHQAIKSLPTGARLVFNLFVLEGMSHKEVAKDLGISESTSKTQLRRAKMLIRQRLS